MQAKRKLYFSMIEVLVAMGLAMSAFAALMGFYAYVSYMGKRGKEIEKQSFETLYLQNRLAELLPQAIPYYKSTKKKKESAELKTNYNFFTSQYGNSPGLTFLFNNGGSNNSTFSGVALGKIYLNTKKQLVFALFPSPLRWEPSGVPPMKTEVLAEGVDRIAWSFFSGMDVNRDLMWKDIGVQVNDDKNRMLTEQMPMGQWIPEWKNEYRKLPALVKLEVYKGQQRTQFVFPLSMSEIMIAYE
jgi:hypothetical protein